MGRSRWTNRLNRISRSGIVVLKMRAIWFSFPQSPKPNWRYAKFILLPTTDIKCRLNIGIDVVYIIHLIYPRSKILNSREISPRTIWKKWWRNISTPILNDAARLDYFYLATRRTISNMYHIIEWNYRCFLSGFQGNLSLGSRSIVSTDKNWWSGTNVLWKIWWREKDITYGWIYEDRLSNG